jgi:hypothetical protein
LLDVPPDAEIGQKRAFKNWLNAWFLIAYVPYLALTYILAWGPARVKSTYYPILSSFSKRAFPIELEAPEMGQKQKRKK